MKNWNKINNLLIASVNNNYFNTPLTFLSLNKNNTVMIKKSGSPEEIDCYYKINGSEWKQYTFNGTNGEEIPFNKGDKVSFKCNTTTFSKDASNYYYFTISSNANVYGNIMSLVQGKRNLQYVNTILNNYQFCMLFYNCYYIVDVSNLLLPATTLAYACYFHMFEGCTNLISAPLLPATTLANSCYESMFEGCKSLTIAPLLPATGLASNCYSYMFQNCSSLTTAPLLPATTLANWCYYSMFVGCTSLSTAPLLPATTLAGGCYSYMFEGCTSLSTAPLLPATNLVSNCYDSMFWACTSLTKAPDLPATTLVDHCYSYMFEDCAKLSVISVNFTDWKNLSLLLATEFWVDGVAGYGIFYKPNELSIIYGLSYIPNGWTVPTDSLQISYYNNVLSTLNEDGIEYNNNLVELTKENLIVNYENNKLTI